MCAVLMFYFFQRCCFEVLYGQLWNVLHIYVPDGGRFLKFNKNRCFFLGFSSFTPGILFFFLLSCFKQCVLGLSGLLGLNAVIILPFYCNAIIDWRCFSFFFFLVSQAFYHYVGRKGYSFCAWMYWVPLWWFVKSTLSCPTPLSFVYCSVINQRGRWLWLSRGGFNRVHCVCPGPWPFNLFFPVVLSLFWLGRNFMAPII